MVLVIQRAVQLLTVIVLLLIKGPYQLITGLFTVIKTVLALTALNILDFILFVINCVTPLKPKGTIVALGNPGYRGIWPEFVPPNANFDSRSPCPYLNALANHGILPHDGKNISMDVMRPAIQKAINSSYTLTLNTANGVKQLFGKSTIDLGDLSRHNVIEHDASVIRADAYFQVDQGTPTKEIIMDLLSTASVPPSDDHPEGALCAADIAKFLKTRIAHSKANNPTFTGLSAFHKLFMSNNCSLLLDTVEGDVRALRTILLEERFPDGWESSFRGRMGYTNFEMELRSAEIYLRML
ncbi:chloroperoxidase-like protein [Clavulina sp. PMI_390]|nr:chloroperoxidase-like protein [Clavulina sp. PMI_390]